MSIYSAGSFLHVINLSGFLFDRRREEEVSDLFPGGLHGVHVPGGVAGGHHGARYLRRLLLVPRTAAAAQR